MLADERVTWVEIDINFCAQRWGVSPCLAALDAKTPNKCALTFKTCAYQSAYTAIPVTLTLTMQNQVGLPISGRYFPCLTKVQESEQTVNIAGSDPKLAALGRRATFKFEARDFVYEDRFLDPYYDERISGDAQFSGIGYQPVGMFFERLRARDPYFANYPVRFNQGRVVDGALVADRTTHYILTEFDPEGGLVRFEGVDVLDLAANDRALVPAPSQGRLDDDITADETEITLTPAGVGEEYGTTGYVTIGREIMRFTRSGDVLTLTRGRFNTSPAAQKYGAAVQEAWRYTGKAHTCVRDLLRYKDTVPLDWIPYDEWTAEAETWFDIDLDAIITKPMPIADALGELSILGFSLFTDLAAQKIRFQPNRFLFPDEADTTPVITDDDIIGDVKYDGRDSERLTRVEFRSVQFDPTQKLDDDNFDQSYLVIAGDKEDPRAYGDVRYRLEKTRWLNQGQAAFVRVIANRYLRRFKTPPERITITVKRRKYGDIALAGIVRLQTRHIPSEFAQIETKLFQVIKRKDANAGEIALTLQRFEYNGNFGFWAAETAPDYIDATDSEKDRIAYWGPDTGDTFADGRPLYEWG